MEHIINFLGDMHQHGLKYATLNVYRSAISANHVCIGGFPCGQHVHIKNIMKGIFNDRPPKPRYGSTWDISVVLRKIRAWGPNSGLTLKQLSHKLAMLIALTTACSSGALRLNFPLKF